MGESPVRDDYRSTCGCGRELVGRDAARYQFANHLRDDAARYQFANHLRDLMPLSPGTCPPCEAAEAPRNAYARSLAAICARRWSRRPAHVE